MVLLKLSEQNKKVSAVRSESSAMEVKKKKRKKVLLKKKKKSKPKALTVKGLENKNKKKQRIESDKTNIESAVKGVFLWGRGVGERV